MGLSLIFKAESILEKFLFLFKFLNPSVDDVLFNNFQTLDLYLLLTSEKELFLAILDELAENPGLGSFKTIDEKIAGMACKASVKGGDRIGFEQAEKLIDELLTLDNPYNCPHGRPIYTVISREKLFELVKRT